MTEYIEREAALLSLTPIVKRASERNRNIYSAVKQCVEAINWTPAADVQPIRHGRLLNPNPYGECSLCGLLIDVRDGYAYCPSCGAKLEAGDTSSAGFAGTFPSRGRLDGEAET